MSPAQLTEDTAGRHCIELVPVAEKDKSGTRAECICDPCHQREVDHRCLVEDKEVGMERVVGIPGRPSGTLPHTEQPVNG